MIRDEIYDVIAVSDAAMVASGTATLETALLETPMVVVYKVSAVSYAIGRRFIRVDHISLVNIIAGRTIVPELIQDDANAERMAAEAMELDHPAGKGAGDEGRARRDPGKIGNARGVAADGADRLRHAARRESGDFQVVRSIER